MELKGGRIGYPLTRQTTKCHAPRRGHFNTEKRRWQGNKKRFERGDFTPAPPAKYAEGSLPGWHRVSVNAYTLC